MDIPEPYDSHPLILARGSQLAGAESDCVLWVVGDTWIKCERGVYFVGADEEVSIERVYELLRDSPSAAYQYS